MRQYYRMLFVLGIASFLHSAEVPLSLMQLEKGLSSLAENPEAVYQRLLAPYAISAYLKTALVRYNSSTDAFEIAGTPNTFLSNDTLKTIAQFVSDKKDGDLERSFVNAVYNLYSVKFTAIQEAFRQMAGDLDAKARAKWCLDNGSLCTTFSAQYKKSIDELIDILKLMSIGFTDQNIESLQFAAHSQEWVYIAAILTNFARAYNLLVPKDKQYNLTVMMGSPFGELV